MMGTSSLNSSAIAMATNQPPFPTQRSGGNTIVLILQLVAMLITLVKIIIDNYFILGTIPNSDSNGFTRSFKRDARENIISDESDKSSFQHQDVILGVNESQSKFHDPENKDIAASRAKDGRIGQDTNDATNSGNGYVWLLNKLLDHK